MRNGEEVLFLRTCHTLVRVIAPLLCLPQWRATRRLMFAANNLKWATMTEQLAYRGHGCEKCPRNGCPVARSQPLNPSQESCIRCKREPAVSVNVQTWPEIFFAFTKDEVRKPCEQEWRENCGSFVVDGDNVFSTLKTQQPRCTMNKLLSFWFIAG